ncbi:6066_t:CDS:2 [Acaulospora colombiana]|uniref:6066_t:CDS:1 n=1 Tax=Acaulospora colombiana TaxID=27376 RepID=A0ACA9LYK7_9GLOM|nr:6066_t:CDS:2 [Acaulospora colombiana]
MKCIGRFQSDKPLDSETCLYRSRLDRPKRQTPIYRTVREGSLDRERLHARMKKDAKRTEPIMKISSLHCASCMQRTCSESDASSIGTCPIDKLYGGNKGDKGTFRVGRWVEKPGDGESVSTLARKREIIFVRSISPISIENNRDWSSISSVVSKPKEYKVTHDTKEKSGLTYPTSTRQIPPLEKNCTITAMRMTMRKMLDVIGPAPNISYTSDKRRHVTHVFVQTFRGG